MGLTSTFQNAANSIVNSFGDLRSTLTFKDRTVTAYVPGTGPTISVTTSSVVGVLDDASTHYWHKDHGILQTSDKAFIFANKDYSLTPSPGDRVTCNGMDWTVFAVNEDTAQAAWVLILRGGKQAS